MTKTVSFLSEAADDLQAAVAWYDEEEPGLGDRFAVAVHETLDLVAEQPAMFRVLSGPYRRALVHPFPYLVVFRDTGDAVVVAAVWHGKRSGRRLLARLPR